MAGEIKIGAMHNLGLDPPPAPPKATPPPKSKTTINAQPVFVVGVRLPFLDVVELVIKFWVISFAIGAAIGAVVFIAALLLMLVF